MKSYLEVNEARGGMPKISRNFMVISIDGSLEQGYWPARMISCTIWVAFKGFTIVVQS